MKISKIKELLNADILCGEELAEALTFLSAFPCITAKELEAAGQRFGICPFELALKMKDGTYSLDMTTVLPQISERMCLNVKTETIFLEIG